MIERNSKGRFIKGGNLGHPPYGGFSSRFKKGHDRSVESCDKCGGFISKVGNHKCHDSRKQGLMSALKQQNSKEPTGIEKKVYEELKNRGLLFEKQYLVNGKFLVDAWIPSLNLIIEADGKYWHSLDRIVKKDKAENAYLTKCGFNLLRLSEEEINNGSFKEKW